MDQRETTHRMAIADEAPRGAAPGDSSLVYLAAAVLRRWKMILALTAGAVVVAFGLSFLRRDVYTATTVLLMQQETDVRLEGLVARLPAGLGAAAGGTAGGSNARLVNAILGSRTLGDTLERRIGRVRKREVQGDLERGQSLMVLVSDPDPERAARVANAYPEVVNELVGHITGESTRRKQELLSAAVAEARRRLEETEARTVAFERQGAPEIREQMRASLEAAVELQRQINIKEIQLSQLRRTATPENPELRRLTAEVGALRDQLRRMTAGTGDASVLPALGASPELRATAVGLLREYTEAEAVYTSLAASLAQTQIAANNRLPVLTVLDPALVPTRPAGRGSVFLAVIAGVLGLTVGVVAVMVSEYLRAARRNARNGPLFSAWSEIRDAEPARGGRRSETPVGD